MITAPFNFVPLSEKVFFPDWADEVSHDVPFEDSQNDVIDITITAKSPIFVRDGEEDTKFCNHEGTHYIPSSSVKGMVRNVLEILSFSKIQIDKKKHSKYMSVRDMTNRKELVGTANGCGFLKQGSDGKWYIEDYGKPRTIGYKSKHEKIIGNINCDFETAQEKYNQNNLTSKIKVKKSVKDLISRDGKKIGTKNIAHLDSSGEDAYLILTGGIDNKKNEFVFVSSDKEKNPIQNIDNAVKKFKNAYFESDSIDGNYWKNNWDKEIGIPIFYVKDKQGKVSDLGLSQLFKLAYDSTIDNATKQDIEYMTVDGHKDEKLDLAQTIFGTIRENAPSLKGRVQFSHFKADDNVDTYGEVTVVLGSPNASFYPEYIEQDCSEQGKLKSDNYHTLKSNSSKISGWKRYPLHKNKIDIKSVEASDSSTTFNPLGKYEGSTFKEFTFSGKVRFHNLKKLELGALLSALTFHNNHNQFYHNIGMAKSLGLGKIKIDIDTSKYQDALEVFELYMNDWAIENVGSEWIDAPQLKELFTMAYHELNIDSKLKYLILDPEKKVNEFVDKKKAKQCLPKCSELFDLGDNAPKTLISRDVREQFKKKLEEEKELKRISEEKAKVAKEFQTALNSTNPQILQNFIDKYPEHEKLHEVKEKKEEIESINKANKYKEVDAKAKSAYEALQNKKSTKQYKKECEKFIKKWSAEKNHKGSLFILELIKNLK